MREASEALGAQAAQRGRGVGRVPLVLDARQPLLRAAGFVSASVLAAALKSTIGASL